MKKILKIVAFIEFAAAILTAIGSAASPIMEAYKQLMERLDALLTKEERDAKQNQNNPESQETSNGMEYQDAEVIHTNVKL